MRVLMAFIIGLMALLAPAGAQEVGEELLRNPGFNEDANGDGVPDGWSTSPRQVLWREKEYQSRDYEIVSRPGTYVLATQDVRLKPGKQYTLTLTCKAVEGGLAGALLLHGPDRPRREMQILWNIHATDRYEEYVALFTAPDPACRLYLYNVAKTKGTVSYDHVSLREGAPDRPIFTPLTWKPVDRLPGERREDRAIRRSLAERDVVVGDGALGLGDVIEVEPAGRIRGREEGDVLLVAIRGVDVPEDLHLAARPVGAMQQEGAGQTALYRFARQREGILLPRLQPDVLGCQHVGARTRDDFIIPALVLLLAPEHLPWGGAPAVWHSIAVRVFIETGVAE